MTETVREFQILLVEDSATDADLARRALRRGRYSSQVSLAQDGEQALAMLRREGRYSECLRPDLVLLDLNLPRIGGRQVLQEIRNDGVLKSIPVVVLTTAAEDADIETIYAEGANTYIVKPVDLDQFYTAVDSILQYWLTVASLPRCELSR